MPNSASSTRPLRILILSWELLPVYAGGLGILVRDVVDELKAQGNSVKVLMPRIPPRTQVEDAFVLPRLYNRFYREDKPIKELDYGLELVDRRGRTPGATWPPLFQSAKKSKKGSSFTLYPNNLPRIVRAYARTCAEHVSQHRNDYDLIIGMDWMATPAYHLIKQLDLDIPFFFHVNSTEWDRAPNPRRVTAGHTINKRLESELFLQADAVLAISQVTKQALIEHCRVPEEKITVISNDLSFDPEQTGYTELDKGKNVLYIGRITAQKGLPFLLDTAEKVIGIDSQIRFLIAGDGEDMSDTVETIAERCLEKNCIVIGWVNGEQKKQLYKSADLFVMTSPSEPFGLTPLEAIISDVPVISSKNCGFLDVIPSTPTYAYHDTARFAEILLHYINDPADRAALLQKQKEEYGRHSWSEQIKKITDLAREHLARLRA